jgi:UDP-N-acetylmuramate-alanine ligase
MILGSRKAFAVIAAAAALASGIGAGAAAGGAKHRAPGVLLKAAVQYLGVSRAELLKDARAGQTLAQIATAHGKSVDGLEAAMLAAVKTKLDAAVSAGKLTAAREQAKLARAEKLVERLVNSKLGAKAGKRLGAKAGVLRVSAKYIGVTPKALAAELKAGKSLAQVAAAHGKTAAGLKEALLKPVKAKLDKAVASGRITAVQAQARLDKLSARLDQLINKTR